jgi:molybdopterin-guanine dinucleotide biosynthesis protein A
MGKDKALIEINHQPLLQKTCLTALECTEEVYVITPRFEEYQGIIPEKCRIIEENQPFYHGPLVAFAQGLEYITADWILLLALDLPFLNSTELKTWIRYLPQLKSETMAFLPKTDKGWECLCGFYHRSCGDSLREFVKTGGNSFQNWLKSVPIEVIPVENSQILFNCNTPLDLDYLKSVNG